MTKYQIDEVTGLWYDASKMTEFAYSEGDLAEEKLLQIITDADDKSIYSKDLSTKIDDWSTLYHLSARRSNLLRPIIDMLDGPILEIGAGSGAVTRFLGEAGKEVVAVEGSRRRAECAAVRCRDLPNVKVLATQFGELDPRFKFNTVLIIGVLEYARQFDNFEALGDRCDAFLEHAKTFLNPGGRLVIAIENQLGLKYLAGYPEDHTGQAFFGIEDKYSQNTVVTFGRKELADKVGRLFKHLDWWYPFPDYKVPITVLSEKGATPSSIFNAETLCAHSVIADPQNPSLTTFALDRAYAPFTRNGLLADVANSFLVVASDEHIADDGVLGYHYGMDRSSSFTKAVTFRQRDGELVVDRKSLGYAPKDGDLVLVLDREPYAQGQLWHDELRRIVAMHDWTVPEIVDWLRIWWVACCETLGFTEHKTVDLRKQVSGNRMDLIPRNMIKDGDRCTFIDQEWDMKVPIELGFLLFRGINDALHALDMCHEPADGVPLVIDQIIMEVLKGLGYWISRDDVRRFKDLERQFQEWVGGDKPSFIPETFGDRSLKVRPRFEALVSEYLGRTAASEKIEMLENTIYFLDNHINDMISKTSARKIVEDVAKRKMELLSDVHYELILTVASTIEKAESSLENIEIVELLKLSLQNEFQADWYLQQNNDVRDAGVDPFIHFLKYGSKEGRRPNPGWG